MHPLAQFKYCPKCGSPRFVEHNQKSKHCEACGFTYYFNPSAATVALIEREVPQPSDLECIAHSAEVHSDTSVNGKTSVNRIPESQQSLCTMHSSTMHSPTMHSQSVESVMQNGQIEWCVVRRAKEPAKGTLDLPGGFSDMFETSEEGVIREVKEETGLDVDRVEFLFSIPNQYEYSGFLVHTIDMFYRCHVRTTEGARAADDAGELLWMRPEDIHPEDFGLKSIRCGVERLLNHYRANA